MINICFHGIGEPRRTLEPGEEPYWISTQLYDEVLDLVQGRPDVALSFDDGNVTDVEHGLEGLLRRDLKATFFVLAGRLDQPGSLGTADLRALRQQGMTIGSHGMDHVPWRSLSETGVTKELVEARARIGEAGGAPVTQAALPLGRYDRTTLSHLRRLGYERVYSSDRRHASSRAWLQPRFSLRGTDTKQTVQREMLTPAPPVRRWRSRAVGLVKRLR